MTGRSLIVKRTFIFYPPLKQPSGGMRVLLDIARHLERAGRPVAVVVRDTASIAGMGAAAPQNVVDWEDTKLSEEDIWLVPEGWVNALTPGLRAGCRCVVYCQNWAYLFSGLPDGVGWDRLDVAFLAVSHPVAFFIREALGVDAPILPPGIDSSLFFPPAEKPGGLRIGFMPRKNRAVTAQIRQVLAARKRLEQYTPEWVSIQDKTAAEVADLLRSCHLFVDSGYPEGFGLPALEAMACGCIPVGFAGFGGWDYKRQIEEKSYAPWWPLREVAWGGNGFWVADGDVLAAVLGLEEAALLWQERSSGLTRTLDNGRATAQAYSLVNQFERVNEIWLEWDEQKT